MKKRIEVGKRYACKGNKIKNFGLREEMFFTIIHKGPTDGGPGFRNYVGISDTGLVVDFDCTGEDEWFEFGGCWYALDAEIVSEPKWKLEKL